MHLYFIQTLKAKGAIIVVLKAEGFCSFLGILVFPGSVFCGFQSDLRGKKSPTQCLGFVHNKQGVLYVALIMLQVKVQRGVGAVAPVWRQSPAIKAGCPCWRLQSL